MRVGGQSPAVHFTPEIVQLIFVEAPLQEGAGIDPGGTVTLEEDQVAQLFVVAPLEKIVEAHVVQGRRRGKAGDMATQALVVLVCPHHHGQGIPADQGADAALHEQVAGHTLFPRGGNGIAKRGGDGIGRGDAGFGGGIEQLADQKPRAFLSLETDDGVQGFEPFLCFCRIVILIHKATTSS